MSVEQAKQFLVKISTDEEAADKAREAHEASLLKVAEELGFTLEASDLEAAMGAIAEVDELSDDELDEVAGGITPSLSFRPSLFSRLSPFSRPSRRGFTIRDSLLY